jgi:hypothetical protein
MDPDASTAAVVAAIERDEAFAAKRPALRQLGRGRGPAARARRGHVTVVTAGFFAGRPPG